MTNRTVSAFTASADANLLVITTGGTIDAQPYDPAHTPARVTPNDPSIIPAEIEKIVGRNDHIEYVEWTHADSNDISQAQLIELLEKVKNAPQNRILITHGTDTMVANAKFFQEQLKDIGKTVLFVGAMQPILNGAESDGIANLTLALEQIGRVARQGLGVRIVGRAVLGDGQYAAALFDPGRAVKDKEAKVFRQTVKSGERIPS